MEALFPGLPFVESICKAQIHYTAIPMIIDAYIYILVFAIAPPLLNAEKITEINFNASLIL